MSEKTKSHNLSHSMYYLFHPGKRWCMNRERRGSIALRRSCKTSPRVRSYKDKTPATVETAQSINKAWRIRSIRKWKERGFGKNARKQFETKYYGKKRVAGGPGVCNQPEQNSEILSL